MDKVSAAEVIEKRLAEASLLGPTLRELQELSVGVELTYCDPNSNSALRLDLDGQIAVGRLTWWSDGSLFVEALRSSDGTTLVSQHGTAATAAEVVNALRALAGVMAGLPSNNSVRDFPSIPRD